jgi:ATP-dependent protease ClpP protease subunit
MGNLYNENISSTANVNPNYTSAGVKDSEKWFQEFREFDYGIDIENNIILIQDEIVAGLSFDFISKVRLLRKINPSLTNVTILLNSPGGDVIETLGLIDYLNTLNSDGIKT